jgi:hypothetical protein
MALNNRPPDGEQVLDALRLGWTLAEVRGRNRPDAPGADLLDFPHGGHALPLRSERTAVEQAVEAEAVLAYLATALKVDGPQGAGPDGRGGADQATTTYSQALLAVAHTLHDGPGGSGSPNGDGPLNRPETWDQLADCLYHWDAHIQDTLAAESETQSSAYQLGRGLAEAYWALDPTAADGEPGSWTVLLGEQRRRLLTRHAGRLAAYFDPLTAPALAGSLQVWGAVVADPGWRGQADAVSRLRSQTHRWYALLVLGQDPSTLVQPGSLIRHSRTTLRAARMFAPQLLVGLLSFGAITAVSYLLATDTGSAGVATVLGAVGFLGLSGASLQASLKNRANAILERLRTNAYADLVAEAITVAPTVVVSGHGLGMHPAEDPVHRAASQRTLSVATSHS